MSDFSCIIKNYHPDDFNKYLQLHLETEQSDRSGRYLSRQTLTEELNRPSYTPEKNLFLAESSGKILGFCSLVPELEIGRVLLNVLVHPHYRREGTATRLLRHAIKRAKELKAGVAQVEISEANVAARGWLSRQGFKPVRRFFKLRLKLSDASWPKPKPVAFMARSLKAGEVDKLTEIQNRSFKGAWGFKPNTAEEILYCLNSSGCSIDGVILLCDKERPIGYCWTIFNPKENLARGINKSRIHMMGVDPDFRGKGLGRVVLLAGLSFLRDQLIELVELTVDSENKAACALYESIGFEIFSTTFWYEMVLA